VIFVDTNVLIDFASGEGEWVQWARRMLATGRARDDLAINHVVLAEFSPGFDALEPLLAFLDDLGISVLSFTAEAAFRSGQAHSAYRQAGGAREAILADFLIGGHAAALDAKLLTRDRQRFATYFPELTLITPETEHG
jgi:hypothetical protein